MDENIETNEEIEQEIEQEDVGKIQEDIKLKDKRIEHSQKYIRKLQSKIDSLTNEVKVLPKQDFDALKPDPAKYDSDEKYMEDKIQWEVKKATQKIEGEIEGRFLARTENEYADNIHTNFVNKAAEKYQDIDSFYDTVYGGELQQIYSEVPQLKLLVEGLDNGPEMAMYLAKNTDVAHRLINLPPYKLVPEMIKLQSSVSTNNNNKTNNNHTPINPVKSSKTPIKGQDPDKMSYADWKKIYGSGRS